MKITELLETSDKRSVYRTGMCDAMAIALHELTGLPLAAWRGTFFDEVFDEESTEDCHICVVVSFNATKWIDVDGVHTGIPKNCFFNNPVTEVNLVPITKNDAAMTFSSDGVTPDEVGQAKDFIKNDPMLSSIVNSISPVL